MENNNDWLEVRKECDIDENGSRIEKYVILERVRRKYFGMELKDTIDISLKFFGLFAIFIPLLLLYFQQSGEKERQFALAQMDVFIATTSGLSKLTHVDLSKKEFDSISRVINYELYPKLSLFAHDHIIKDIEIINSNLSVYSFYSEIIEKYESIRNSIAYKTLMKRLKISQVGYALDTQNIPLSEMDSLSEVGIKLGGEIALYRVDKAYEFSNEAASSMAEDIFGGYFSKTSFKMATIDSVLYLIVKSSQEYFTEIQYSKSMGKGYERDQKNSELQSMAKNISNKDYEYFELLKDLKALNIEHLTHISKQVSELNRKFVRSNKILEQL